MINLIVSKTLLSPALQGNPLERELSKEVVKMKRFTMNLLDMQDACDVDNVVNELLNQLSRSKANGVNFQDYEGRIRLSAFYSKNPADLNTVKLVFLVDFPLEFERNPFLGNEAPVEFQTTVSKFLQTEDFSQLVALRLVQNLIAINFQRKSENPFIMGLRYKSSAPSDYWYWWLRI